jgi:hypothetical protein
MFWKTLKQSCMGNFEQGKTWYETLLWEGEEIEDDFFFTLAQSPWKKDVNYNQSHLELNGVDHCEPLWNN